MREVSGIRLLVAFVFLLQLPPQLQAQPPLIQNVNVLHQSKGHAQVYWETVGGTPAFSTTLNQAVGVADIGEGGTLRVANGSAFLPGSVVRVGREYMLVYAADGNNLSVLRGYDYLQYQFSVVNGGLRSIRVVGNLATVETTIPHLYQSGQRIQVTYSLDGLSGVYAITVTGPTTFTFSLTSEVPAGTYANAAMVARPMPEEHAAGEAVSRAGSDSTVCYGLSTSYGQVARFTSFTSYVQTNQHYVSIGGLVAGTLYHFRVMSTPYGQPASNCANPSAATAVSQDFTFTTAPNTADSAEPVLPDSSVEFQTSVPAITGSRLTTASDCSDLQSALNAAAASDGNLTHEIRIPSRATCSGNWTLPLKNGPNPNGVGWIVVRSDADESLLPPEGIRMRGDWYTGQLPKLRTTLNRRGAFDPVFRMAPKSHHYRLMGLEISTDPAVTTPGAVILINTMSEDAGEYLDPANQPHHLIVDRAYIHGNDNNSTSMGIRLACNYCAVVDSEIVDIATRVGDGGAVQLDNSEGPIRIINNKLQGSSIGGFYASDNSTIPTTDVRNVVFRRNFVTKRRSWKPNAPEFAAQVSLPIISATNAPAALFRTDRDFEVDSNDWVSFTGGTGAWAALNTREFLISDGTLLSISSQAGVATVTTGTAHALQVGQRIRINGMAGFPCRFLNTETTIASVPTSTTFTYPTGAADGTCRSTDGQVLTVYRITKLDNRSFTVPVNSSSFGSFSGQALQMRYGKLQVVKNTFEIKAGRNFLVEGNIVEHSFSQDQAGWLMALSVRGADMYLGWPVLRECGNCGKTIQDILVRNNIFQGGCTWFVVLGDNTNGPTDNLRRVKLMNNLVSDVSDYWGGAIDGSAASCHGAAGVLSQGYEDLTVDHNTVVQQVSILETASPPGTQLKLTNNIFRFGTRGIANEVRASGAAAWDTTVINGHLLDRNIFWGDRCAFRGSPNDPCAADDWGFQKQYYNGTTEGTLQEFNANYWPVQDQIKFAGAKQVQSLSNTEPISVTVTAPHGCATGDRVLLSGATGNTAANGYWTIRVTSDTTFSLIGSKGNGTTSGAATVLPLTGTCANFRLSDSSPFKAGKPTLNGTSGPGNDNQDVGANVDQIEAAVGLATLRSITLQNGVSAEFLYTAPIGEKCYVDLSNDNFATSTRVSDNPTTAERVLSVPVPGAAPADYSYRLQCASFQFGDRLVAGTTRSPNLPSRRR